MSKAQWIKENLKNGEEYAGIILGKDSESDHHLILIPGESEKVAWGKAKEWAAQAGGDLPTRREQSLLFANLKERFQTTWYWSCEQHAADSGSAWCQDFSYGIQLSRHKDDEVRARAVRRLII